MQTKRICTDLDTDLVTAFQQAVLERHGTTYGHLGREVARAIALHLDRLREEAKE